MGESGSGLTPQIIYYQPVNEDVMKRMTQYIKYLFIIAMALQIGIAQATSMSPLVPFASKQGIERLSHSMARVDFADLANQFEAQSNVIFCGPTSASIVLNALYFDSQTAPRDGRRLSKDDYQYIPDNLDPTVPRFTQESVIENGLKTRAQVLGQPLNINGKIVGDFGYQLRQLAQMIEANGARVTMRVVSDTMDSATIRKELIRNLKHKNDYVIVAYKRSAVGQQGGGHISPVAAYDKYTDSFLVMDVNPARAGWVWMTSDTLIAGMRTFDTVENRGYLLVSATQ